MGPRRSNASTVSDAGRIDIIRPYFFLDPDCDAALNEITHLAARLCATPIAAINLIESGRQWFKTTHGLDAQRIPHGLNFCRAVMLQNQLLLIPDTSSDIEYAVDPAVTGFPHLRFFAGVPLTTRDGHASGTLFVADRCPRTLDLDTQETLCVLARQAATHLEMGRKVHEIQRAEYSCLRAERDLRQHNELLQLQQAVAAAANQANSIREALRAGVNLVCAHTHWPVGHAYLLSLRGNPQPAHAGIWHLDDAERFSAFCDATNHQPFTPGTGLSTQVLTTGRPLCVPDLTRHSKFRRIKVAQACGLQSAYFFPITSGSTIVGLMEFFSPRQQAPHDRFLEVMAYVAQQLGQVVERHNSSEALQRSQDVLQQFSRHYELILNAVGDGIFGVDSRGNIIFENPAAARLLGWEPNEILGHSIGDTLCQDNPPLSETLATGASRHAADETFWRKDGTCFQAEYLSTPMLDEQGQLIGAVLVFRDITERNRAEAALQHSKERYRSLVENARELIITLAPTGEITSLNPAFERLTGWSRAEWLSQPLERLAHPDDINALKKHFLHPLDGPALPLLELRLRRSNGSDLSVQFTVTALLENGKIVSILGIGRDITEQRHLEEQFRHAQKMEAVGRLAGGVAHDFNNILTAILGFSELLLRQFVPASPNWLTVCEIKKSAERAASLTRQLLVFSRKQILEPKVFELNEVVTDTGKMVCRLIGEDIDLVSIPGATHSRIKADLGQIEQVILNLVVNARDAMPAGGHLTISTGNVTLTEDFARQHPPLVAGDFVTLTIRDTGVGMTPEVKAHLFEPFFTTKDQTKGTGLGLATCFSIVQQSGGYIAVESELHCGTAFTIYLPVVNQPAEISTSNPAPAELPAGQESILLVEDEPIVRELARIVLHELGYKITEAGNGAEAIELAAQQSGNRFDLMITDVVMPLIGGKELTNSIKATHPDLKVLFTSGYTDDAIIHHGVLDRGLAFLQKPYTTGALARKVREVLDQA